MKNLELSLRKLEDVLSASGVKSYCYNSEEFSEESTFIGKPSITVVVHSDDALPLIRSSLKANRSKVLEIFGEDVEIAPQFISYFFSYLYFGRYVRSYQNIFLSTRFTNLKEPILESNETISALGFSLTAVGIIEGIADKTPGDIEEDVKIMCEDFNFRSRYIKVSSLKFGHLDSRLTFKETNIDYKDISLSIW